MPELHVSAPSVTRFIRKLRGISHPILAEASDGFTYVVKFNNITRSPNLAFNEGAGTELFRACGLSVPKWTPLLVSDIFLDQNHDSWMEGVDGAGRPTPGLCFGSRYLGNQGALLEILPKSFFRRIRNRSCFFEAWMVDASADHVDNRQAVFVESADRWIEAVFVDNGHLFGGPIGNSNKSYNACRYLDSRIYSSMKDEETSHFERVAVCRDADRLWQQVNQLPDVWLVESGLKIFAKTLDRLSNAEYLRDLAGALIDAIKRSDAIEKLGPDNIQEPAFSLLHPGIQRSEK